MTSLDAGAFDLPAARGGEPIADHEERDMSESEPQPDKPPPPRPFQFSLRTLLLLFVVLASSMAVFGGWGLLVFGLVLGSAIYLHYFDSLPLLYLLLLVLCLTCLIGMLLPAVNSASGSVRGGQCANNLRQIALALLNYEQANGCFPPAYIADKNGKPVHSWRVLILPYLDETAMYKMYDFTQPWDGPKNRKLLATRPPVFCCPGDRKTRASGANQASYVAVVGAKAAWAGGKARKVGEFDNRL